MWKPWYSVWLLVIHTVIRQRILLEIHLMRLVLLPDVFRVLSIVLHLFPRMSWRLLIAKWYHLGSFTDISSAIHREQPIFGTSKRMGFVTHRRHYLSPCCWLLQDAVRLCINPWLGYMILRHRRQLILRYHWFQRSNIHYLWILQTRLVVWQETSMHSQYLIDLILYLILVVSSWWSIVIAELVLHIDQLLLQQIHIVLSLESATYVVWLIFKIIVFRLLILLPSFKILNRSRSYRLLWCHYVIWRWHKWSRWIFEYASTAVWRWWLVRSQAFDWGFDILFWFWLFVIVAQKSQCVAVHCYLMSVIIIIFHLFHVLILVLVAIWFV